MVKVIICGTIGLDTIKTPFGEVKDAIGGSATYACLAASLFVETGIVSIAGKDLPEQYLMLLKNKNINTEGVSYAEKNFRWSGEYTFDMNEAKTLKTDLNALLEFKADLPESYKKEKYLFLANIDPELQLKVLDQSKNPVFTMMDTMNFWITSKKEQVKQVMKKVDAVLLNEGEARQLFETVNLIAAGKKALELGPDYVIIKKGEHGALLFTRKSIFNAPSYPLEVIKDPTGCGDSFAGALIGYLAKNENVNEETMRKAVIYGSVVASFTAEDFSVETVKAITKYDIEQRYKEFEQLRSF
ncbi:bifunctional hydroxymethylpyrimidine kinase/phosphomethylpyrimidine kinase [Candidatus Woesearchaeota archaeon]|nr:bifunctional hydroxymethylpyrimidine kinase/phosphomethylpyrimidine kinase [Candidatus Woesearchaeota archaeon]